MPPARTKRIATQSLWGKGVGISPSPQRGEGEGEGVHLLAHFLVHFMVKKVSNRT